MEFKHQPLLRSVGKFSLLRECVRYNTHFIEAENMTRLESKYDQKPTSRTSLHLTCFSALTTTLGSDENFGTDYQYDVTASDLCPEGSNACPRDNSD